MLLLTADRPPELRDVGANQTINQVKIFGEYAEWFVDLPCPGPQVPDGFLASCIRHAVQRSREGPVHINWMFREPFGACDETIAASVVHRPATRFDCFFAGELPAGDTIVIAGGCPREAALAAGRLAARLGSPFLSDVTNGVRSLAYDLQLLCDDNPPPEVVVHVGGRLVSKRWWQFLEQNPPRHFLHFWPHRNRLIPLHRVTEVVTGDIVALCQGVTTRGTSSAEFLGRWQRTSAACLRTALAVIAARDGLTEKGVAIRVAEQLPHGHGLFLGNSMPIRDMDRFGFWSDERDVRVGANRGASGIDGLVASACGFARGLRQPVTAVIGDLAALHDLNSLALMAQSTEPIVLIVVNNDGGGIFHFLPIAEATGHFERYFATPHGLGFASAAEMFGLDYAAPASAMEFAEAYRHAAARGRSTLLEVRTSRGENVQLQRDIEQAVRCQRAEHEPAAARDS
jgi:2-succinyl-5-enolpyruvyl-6-hydroxy-3-cyclohexene-1-carboxylate synthase